jgi:hypothetical protein
MLDYFAMMVRMKLDCFARMVSLILTLSLFVLISIPDLESLDRILPHRTVDKSHCIVPLFF